MSEYKSDDAWLADVYSDIANRLATDLFDTGCDPRMDRPHRIQFMTGTYPNEEHGIGGFSEAALVNFFIDRLIQYVKEMKE